jgi:hypothetical protein
MPSDSAELAELCLNLAFRDWHKVAQPGIDLP